MTNTIINLPFFPGFYESILSQSLDNAVEREVGNLRERESCNKYYPESYWPEELRLDHSYLWEFVNYGDAYNAMAQDYVSAFDDWASDNLGAPLNSFTFESMRSPREYNFETDRVFAFVPLEVMRGIYESLDVQKLKAAIESRHTSRSGFISFYSNEIDDWQDKEFSEFDHNELATILCAAIGDKVDSEFDWTLCESIIEQDYVYLDSNVDWPAYESRCNEQRAAKLAELMESDSDQAARMIASDERIAALVPLAMEDMDSDSRKQWEAKESVWAAKHYRCPLTLDLFAGESA